MRSAKVYLPFALCVLLLSVAPAQAQFRSSKGLLPDLNTRAPSADKQRAADPAKVEAAVRLKSRLPKVWDDVDAATGNQPHGPYQVLVDAATGDILLRYGLTAHNIVYDCALCCRPYKHEPASLMDSLKSGRFSKAEEAPSFAR